MFCQIMWSSPYVNDLEQFKYICMWSIKLTCTVFHFIKVFSAFYQFDKFAALNKLNIVEKYKLLLLGSEMYEFALTSAFIWY